MDTQLGRPAHSLPGRAGHSRMVPAPFIVGTRSAGTTMLRLMLDAHPDLAIPFQTHFIPTVAHNCGRASDPRKAFVETLTSLWRWPNFHVDDHVLEERVAVIDPFDVGEGLRAFYRIYAENHGKPRWGDKTPGYGAQMHLIQKLLPEAHFIHIIRDGRAVAVSLNDAWRSSGRMKSVPEAAAWWVRKIEKARRQADGLSFYLEVRYEDLVLETESTLKRICEFIELPWNPVMLEYHHRAEDRMAELVVVNPTKSKTLEDGRSRHARTSTPPDPTRIDRWEREMTDSDRREFEGIAGELLVKLGYD